MPFGYFQKDVLVKTETKFSTYSVSFIKGLKEERRCKTEGRRKKDEMVGLSTLITSSLLVNIDST
jgi:hypothetical protein